MEFKLLVSLMLCSHLIANAQQIIHLQWQSGKDHVLRGYDFAYDGLNRLEKSTYAEGADMSQNKNRYSENVLSYFANGSIERLQRYGKKNNGTFGLIDDLTYSYNGNQIMAISDKAGSLLYNGSFDFKDGANADVEYFYDANGALVKDLNKGISNIEYDILGNLKCITFSNGFKTKYIYDAAGNKLRTTHESVVTNTTDYIGKEFDHMHGLDWYDHGARMYDAARVASTSENYEIDADALRRMIDKLLRLNTNSHLIFK